MFRCAVLLFLAVHVRGSAIPNLLSRFRPLDDGRIVGGIPMKITDVPYQISLQRHNRHMCGGSIISEYHVLTAAHCSVLDPIAGNLLIGSGVENLGIIQKHEVTKNTYHPLFSGTTIDYDVAVLRVAHPFVFGATTQPIKLVTDAPADDEPVLVTGWGALESGGSLAPALYGVEINIINHDTCNDAYQPLGTNITSRMICAGLLSGGKDSCQGDSGGPMVSKKTKKQVGIVSWGYKCAEPYYPGVYTNVADKEVQAFIQAKLKQ